MLLSLDSTLLVQLVNFIVFLAILNAIFLKPVGRAIAERRAYINSVGADIERFEGELATARAQAAEILAVARRDAEARIAEERASAQSVAAQIVADHQVQAATLIADAQATVALEAAGARANQSALVESLARTMLERAVGPELAA